MKSAYEAALEKLESQGIERPREESLAAETKQEIAAIRQKSEARLAELEILHRDRMKALRDPDAREKEEEEYVAERRRIEENRDRQIKRLRDPS